MKISLKDLLAIVAVFAVVFGCAAYVGFGNPLFWTTMIGSGLMSAAFVSAIRQKPSRIPKSPLLFFVGSFLLTSITLSANALILFVAGAKLARNKHSTLREALAVVAVGLLVSLMIGIAPGLGESRKLAALQQKYPRVSLVDRLEYEKQHQPTYDPVVNSTTDSVSRRLREDEERIEWIDYRNSRFARIHYEQQEQFVRAIGFGVGRMAFYALVVQCSGAARTGKSAQVR